MDLIGKSNLLKVSSDWFNALTNSDHFRFRVGFVFQKNYQLSDCKLPIQCTPLLHCTNTISYIYSIIILYRGYYTAARRYD